MDNKNPIIYIMLNYDSLHKLLNFNFYIFNLLKVCY